MSVLGQLNVLSIHLFDSFEPIHFCRTRVFLAHSILTVQQVCVHFFSFSGCIFEFTRPRHDCEVKCTSCSNFYTKNNHSHTLKYKKYINYLIRIINFRAKNGRVGWNGLT